MKLISYLNMHRARLGYVNCVLLAADVQLDTPTALRRRLDKLLFEDVVFTQEPSFQDFAAEIDPSRWKDIDGTSSRRELRPSKRTRRGVLPPGMQAESPVESGPSRPSYSRSDLWIYQKGMRSDLGKLLSEYSDGPIELAKDLGLLSPGYSLTEFGTVARSFLLDRLGDPVKLHAVPNPLEVFDDFRLRLMYLHCLMRQDIVFIGLLDYISTTHSLSDCLRKSLDLVLNKLQDGVRLDEVAEMRDLSNLRQRIVKDPVDKAQRVPRLEFMVDLGLLYRSPESDSQYAEEDVMSHMRAAFGGLFESPTSSVWLDEKFFGAAAVLYGLPHVPIESFEEKLLYFVRGAAAMGKRMGFIPGRAASLAGCILALAEGKRLEISDLFAAIYAVPRTNWAEFVKFSGGSRLDSEFLVTLDPSLQQRLHEVVASS